MCSCFVENPNRFGLLLLLLFLPTAACAPSSGVFEEGFLSLQKADAALPSGYPSESSAEERFAWVRRRQGASGATPMNKERAFAMLSSVVSSFPESDILSYYDMSEESVDAILCGKIMNLQAETLQGGMDLGRKAGQTQSEQVQEYQAYVAYFALKACFEELCIDEDGDC